MISGHVLEFQVIVNDPWKQLDDRMTSPLEGSTPAVFREGGVFISF